MNLKLYVPQLFLAGAWNNSSTSSKASCAWDWTSKLYSTLAIRPRTALLESHSCPTASSPHFFTSIVCTVEKFFVSNFTLSIVFSTIQVQLFLHHVHVSLNCTVSKTALAFVIYSELISLLHLWSMSLTSFIPQLISVLWAMFSSGNNFSFRV